MGMDVEGNDPSSEEGRYFRANIWYWRPIAIYCESIAPLLTDYSKWHYNDGAGLDGPAAIRLADIIQQDIDMGLIEAYAEQWEQETQKDKDDSVIYPFDRELIECWVRFLRTCGGFKIY